MKMLNRDGSCQVVLVGSASESFVRYATGLLDEYGIASQRCDDVYAAMAKLVRDDSEGGLFFIGHAERLTVEDGMFFRKVEQNGGLCCCLAEGGSVEKVRAGNGAKAEGVFVIKRAVGKESGLQGLGLR